MKLKEYTEKLNQLLKDHPEASEYDVITSADDEGNGYNRVHYDPQLGNFADREFDGEADAKWQNSVCLN